MSIQYIRMAETRQEAKTFAELSWAESLPLQLLNETSSPCDHKPRYMICPQDQLTRKCKFWYSNVAEDKLK